MRHGTTSAYRHGCRCDACRAAVTEAAKQRRWRKHGQPLSRVETLWSKVEQAEGCWEWMGWHNDQGYGYISWDGREQPVHRVVLELTTGKRIPEGLQVDHLCRNRGCCNPKHLEVVTHAENIRRGLPAKLTLKDARAIRAATEAGEPHRSIARRFGIASSGVSRIRTGKLWAETP